MGDSIRLYPNSINDYRVIQNYLCEAKIEFIRLPPKSERRREVVLKGIPIDTDIAEIKSELTSLDYQVHSVTQLRNFQTKSPFLYFL